MGKRSPRAENREFHYHKILEVLVVMCLIVFVLSLTFIVNVAINTHYELEQKKLDLARYQFDVQAAQTNRSQQLQAANETMMLLEELMNSRLLETATNLLGAPNEVGNSAKDLAMRLIDRFNVNLECTPLWLCDNKDGGSAKPTSNLSTNECQCQNMPTNIPVIGNNNRENLNFAQSYRASPTPFQNLEYLKEMLDKKLLTQAEYDAKKADLLSKM